jgi:hypothetical protein
MRNLNEAQLINKNSKYYENKVKYMSDVICTIENETIHLDFYESKKRIFDPCELTCSKPKAEKESIDYGACVFKLNNFNIIFRVAKTTPTKPGLFVTIWKRIPNSSIEPFDMTDPFDFFIIATRQESRFGIFVFSKSLLMKNKVLAKNGKGGKRGMRVYPSWVKTTNKQAEKTQQWQTEYFIELDKDRVSDRENILKYFQ